MGDRRAAILQYNSAVQANQTTPDHPADPALAYQLFSSACLNDTTAGVLWAELGHCVGDAGASPAAIAAYRLAMECPRNPEPGVLDLKARAKVLANLGHRLHVLGRNDEGEAYIREAIELKRDDAGAWNCLSLCLSMKGEHDDAVAASYTALSLEPDNATIETALALNLLFRGDLKKGLKHFEARYRYKLKQFLNTPYPQWDGTEGKKVYLLADQGIGDSLSFARFVERAARRCKFLYIGVQKELVRLFKASFQRLSNVEIDVSMAQGWPPAEFWTTFVSLPTALGLSEEEIRNAPGIHIPPFQPAMNWKNPDKRHHIGVAWRGSTVSDIDHHRSFEFDHLLRLYEIPNVQLYSLQIGEKSAELHNSRAAALVRDMTPYILDAADTMGVLRHLDLVVTVESALGHMAGAVGQRTIIPYSALGQDWRLGRQGENIIWYSRHSVVRQKLFEPWTLTFDRVVDAVAEALK